MSQVRKLKSSYREDNYMSADFGPIKTERLIFQHNNGFYEIFVEENSPQRVLFSYLFEVEEKEKSIKNNRQQLTKNGVSSTQEPEDFFIDIILEKIK